MYRKYRRLPVDLEVLMAVQEIAEITEEMELLSSEIVEEILESIEETPVHAGFVVCLLKARNPELENIALMTLDGRRVIVLLYKNKHGVIVSARRTKMAMIRHLVHISA